MTRLAGAALVAALAWPIAAQQPTFRVVVDSIAVDVAVMDGRRPVADLTAADFEVLDNGVPQTIREVAFETTPIDVTLALDVSASVEGRMLETLVRAVSRVADRLRPNDRATLVAFNERVVELARDVDGAALRAATAQLRAFGSTSLFDALTFSLIGQRTDGRRRMLIALTDGRDTLSTVDPRVVIETARRADAAMFFVALGAPLSPFPTQPVPPILDELARITGGTVHRLAPGSDLGSAFLRAFDEFRTSYVLRYTAAGVARGGWHDIAVTVKRKGNITVRARKGYFADR